MDPRELLANVEAGEAWREPDGTGVVTIRELLGVSDPAYFVTDEANAAEHEGLIAARPLQYGGGWRWELTDAGRAELARGAVS